MVGKQTEVEQESIVAEDLRQKAYWSSYCLSAKDNGEQLRDFYMSVLHFTEDM